MQAQTLYWVGGSGNFNDPKHWSLTSGGPSANKIPDANTDVVFDDHSVNGFTNVQIKNQIHVKSLLGNLSTTVLKLNASANSTITISGSLSLNKRIIWNVFSDIVFQSGSNQLNKIDFAGIKLNSNLYFGSGVFSIGSLETSDSKTIKFGTGNYSIIGQFIIAGNIINQNPGAHFDLKNTYFKSNSKFTLSKQAIISAEDVYVMADINSTQNYNVPSSLLSSKGYTSANSVNVVCPVTISLTPACSGSCTGILTVSLSPSCTNTPYRVSVNNALCPAFAAALTNTNIVGSVYTVTNACECLGLNYNIVVFDAGNTFQAGTNGNFTPNNAVLFPSNVPPSCSYSSDGILTGNIFGTGPYTVTITKTGTTIPTFTTTSAYSFSAMSTGTYSFSIVDNGGCVTNLTDFLTAPATLIANAATSTITCNGANNGVFAITPSGGTANYTVNFSNFTSATTNGSLVAASNLGVGPISATVTDSQGCIATSTGNITQPATTLGVTLTTTSVTCNGACTASALAQAAGGTPPYTYSWTASPSTASTALNLCASVGLQTLTVKDFNNCTNSSQTFSITQPSAITTTTLKTNVVCSGTNTGGGTVTPSGGTGPYSYTWSAPGPATLNVSAASNSSLLSYPAPYTVSVKDANNCTITPILFTITQPPAVTLAITTKSVSCFGGNDGSATVTASGGNNTSYTYTWSPTGGNSSVANTLTGGNYTLTVRDASNCPTQTVVNIATPAAGISPNVTFTSQSCNIANAPCNGVINANPSGGTAPYTYTLATLGSTIFTAPPYTNRCSGSYSVTVGSSGGACPLTSVITLTTPSALSATINVITPIACFGTSVGVLNGSPTGGTPTYSLSWITPVGAVPGFTSSISNQAAGIFTLNVIDSKSCTAQTTMSLTQPTSITVSAGTSSISCFSTCNGVLTSTTSGGSPGYGFAWTNSLSVNVGTTATASNLCPGPYTLSVTDASLCVRTQTAQVLSPTPLTITAVTAGVKCFGQSNGSVTLTTSGGTAPYNPTYTLTSAGLPIFSTGTSTNLPAGNYTATITDNNGCSKSQTFAITQPTAPLSAVISGTGSCNVCSGSATVTPAGGTSTYAVLWTSSAGTFVSTSPTITSICPAIYSVTVTDAQGCTTATNISINQIINISINPGAQSILCFGATTGSATTNPVGGSGPYSYSWSPSSQTTQVISGVGAGTYTVFVTDSSVPVACSHSAAITLTSPPAITVTSTQTNVTCFSFTNGAITTTLSGGVGPYTQTWTPTGLNSTSITNIGANTYTLNIRDANLCPASTIVTISESPSISISLAVTNPTGCISALANGSICASASGGSGAGYSYTLTGPSTTSSNATGCFTSLGAGTYSIIVMDGAGCMNNTLTTLSTPSAPIISAVSTSVACFGFSTATAGATITSAAATNFTISWSPAVTFTSNATGSLTGASNLPQGSYFITATDNNGCSNTASVGVTQATSITVNGNPTNLACNSISTGSITVAPTGGTPGVPSYTYAWLPAASITSGQSTQTVTGLPAGVYSLNILDANNCITQRTFTLTQPPAISITAVTSSILCNSACTGSIIANGSGGTGALNYSWTPIGGNTNTITGLCANGTGTVPAFYTLTITDANNCVRSNTYSIAEPTALSSTVSFVQASCSNSCNAVATQTVIGGTPSYSYSWSSSTVTTSSLGALCSGTYIANVTDANGCLFAKPFTVTPTPPLSVTLTPANPLCNAACNGSINTAISGAQGTVSYSWSPAGIGQNPTGLCATPNPIYTLVARDQNSCEVTAVATLTDPPALLVSVTFTNPLCHNNSNGIASVSFTNQVGATSYTWLPSSPVKTTQTATGLAAGNYTVYVKDDNQCQASQSFSITNPSTINVNPSISPSSCSLAVGSIILNPTGGTPGSPTAYTFTWTGGTSSTSTTFSASSLSSGQYTVQIADGLGCTTTTILNVSDSNGPSTIPVISTSLNCNAQCTGAATIDIANIVGGTPSYTAEWTSPIAAQSTSIGALCAGIYNAKVTDSVGCIGFTAVTISEPPPIINTPAIGVPLCAGVCNGSIALNTSGGNAPYTYTWMPISSTSPTLTNLCSGDYTVVVKYNGTCSDTSVINIPVQTSITIAPTVTNNICFGTCNGAIDLNLTGGNAPYNISWSNSQNTPSVSGLCNGIYTVSVLDLNGCVNTETAAITSAPQLVVTPALQTPSCGLCNGTASLDVVGGSAPYTYTWSTSATTSSLTNLCAGIYQVVIKDNNLCTQTETIILNNSNGITGENINTSQIPCSGSCVGAATVSAIGGNPPISYQWLNPVVNDSIISNLCPGTYFVQMVDAQNCIRSASITINPVVTLSVSAFLKLPACGTNTGAITLNIAGGTPSYSIVWNPPAGNTTSLTGLGAGVFSYTVTESGTNSCSVSNAINFSNSNGPIISATQNDIACFGANTGSINTVVTSTALPLTYAWNTGANTPSLTGLTQGIITLTVTDVNLCKAFRTFTLTENPAFNLGTSNVKDPLCLGDCNGSITIAPTGGVLPYTFVWSNSATTNPIVDLCNGTYSVSILDALGCPLTNTNAITSFTILSNSAMQLTANMLNSSCSSVADGSISVTVAGGVPTYSYSWSGPSAFSSNSQSISNLFDGSYTLTVTDNLNCQRDSIYTLVPTLTVVANAGGTKTICPETGTTVLNASGTGGSITYQWFLYPDTINAVSTSPNYTVANLLEPQMYKLVITSSVASCSASDKANVDLFYAPTISISNFHQIPIYTTVNLGGDPTTQAGNTVTWTPGTTLDNPNSFNPVASNTLNTTYTLTVTDINGCTAMDTVQVLLYPEISITSGFTPNGDGKNDVWLIDYLDQFPNNTVEIYNRWGDLLFSSTGYKVPFDGKYKGKDLPVGTYYYVININHPGYPKPITGPLTIFR